MLFILKYIRSICFLFSQIFCIEAEVIAALSRHAFANMVK